jgi:hypothetical protein
MMADPDEGLAPAALLERWKAVERQCRCPSYSR